MFGSHGLPGGVPRVKTRKALIIMSIQNDFFYIKDGFYITKNHDFLPRLKEMIPYFRQQGDIIWVRTIIGAASSSDSTRDDEFARFERAFAEQAEQKRKAKEEAESQNNDAARKINEPTSATTGQDDATNLSMYFPSSRSKDFSTRTSADRRYESRTIDSKAFDGTDAAFLDQLTKPRKGQRAQFCIKGTKGAEILDDYKDLVDPANDLIIDKYFYSAFDQTSLLTSLRMHLTTEIYLCGCFTNTGIYTTAADAVQHGLEVTVVEDCLGYRNEDKHDEAMRQMADIMGVQGIDSEEVINESGGRPIPDSVTPGVTLQDLQLSPNVTKDQTALVMAAQQELSPVEDYENVVGKVKGRGPSPADQKASKRNKAKQESKSPFTTHQPSRTTTVNNDMPQPVNRSGAITLSEGDVIGSGDSRMVHDAISATLADEMFNHLKNEVAWQKMYHRSGEVPRLVAVQGDVSEDGSVPVYRHPADESPPLLPFIPQIDSLRRQVERLLSQPFNHALIQLYRDGEDGISEHADKTLDMVHGSSIVNVSLGATRIMTLRSKKSSTSRRIDVPNVRQIQRVNMPHNSVLVLGPQTNKEWLHGIRPDKRPQQEKTAQELYFGGERISITLRNIGTFTNAQKGTIWGIGATRKDKIHAGSISTDPIEVDEMLLAFSKENQLFNFDWNAVYGAGFDVINMVHRGPRLVPCNDPVANLRVRLALSYKAVTHTVETADTPDPPSPTFRFHPWTHGLANIEKPILKEAEADGSMVEGDLAILVNLERRYPSASVEGVEGYTNSQLFRCATQSNELLYMWREYLANAPLPTHRFRLERPTTPDSSFLTEIMHLMKSWEDYLEPENFPYVAGKTWTILDCAFWPVVHELMRQGTDIARSELPRLTTYHERGLLKKEIAEGGRAE